MSLNLSMLEGSIRPSNIFKTIKYKIKFRKEHPDYFDPVCLWFHTLELYNSYDTYAKMKRYRKEWNGVSRQNLYEGSVKNGF